LINNIIVIGLGNPILGDDGVGWRVAELVKKQVAGLPVDVDCLASGGLSVMERLTGYDLAVIVDAMNLGDTPTGTVRLYMLDDLPDPFLGHLASSHDVNLKMALELGKNLDTHLPSNIMVIAVQSPYVYDFSEQLSSSVDAAVPEAAVMVMSVLHQLLNR
jgi:hydrogenase maturation protease